jgi:hypothetical protein
MTDPAKQMPGHIGAAYTAAVDNILFLRRQQWLVTNYALLLYGAIFIISAHFFNRTDAARNWLGVLTIGTFFVHWYMLNSFQLAIIRFRGRLRWIYNAYFSSEELAGLGAPLEARPHWSQPESYVGLLALSFLGALLTAIYLWSVR